MSVLKLPNVLPFLVFRVFFNARFYYPIFALLFLDFGLTLAQFSLSNLVWAAAIVLLEVPSGALADVLGRKKLVIAASLLMLGEMGVLLVAEPQASHLLLLLFCLNRLLSGAAEAMASGADEALVYDSLKECGEEQVWPRVLEIQTRLSAGAFFTVMLVGAAVYDPEFLTWIFQSLGLEQSFSKAETLKLPIWLTLGSGIVALFAALALKPTRAESELGEGLGLRASFSKVREVANKIVSGPEVAVVIGAAVLFDQVARVALTLSSQTFAAFGFAERWFGVIGAAFALLGMVVAKPARVMAEQKSQAFVFWLLTALCLVGLTGQALTVGVLGLLFVATLSSTMNLVGFFSSYFLNKATESEDRATTLSFKGLALNVAFGTVSLYYAGATAVLERGGELLYQQTLLSLPLYFVFCLLLFLVWRRRRMLQM